MFYVYVIKSKTTDKIYIGQTLNLEQRLKRHNQVLSSKSTSYTVKNKGPWKIVYKEVYKTRKKAIKREKELKFYQGRKYIKNVVRQRAASSIGRANAS